MNKLELTGKVAELAGTSKAEAGRVLEAVIAAISQELAEGGCVHLMDFGSFSIKERAARMGKNPRTGENIPVPACRTVVFKCGKGLKEQVNS